MDPALVERAARLMAVPQGQTALSRVLGGPVKLEAEAHFDTPLTEEKTALLLSLVRAEVQAQGEGDSNASGMSWHSIGEGSQTFVTAHTEGEGAWVRVTVDRRTALAITTVLGGLSLMAVFLFGLIAGEAGAFSVEFGLGLIGAGWLGILTLARKLWSSTGQTARNRMSALMETISRAMGPP